MDALQRVRVELQAASGARVHALRVDVSSLESVREVVGGVRRLVTDGDAAPLGSLLLNAGAQFRGPATYSRDGYEMTFATNCLGHFLLVNLLLDGLEPDGRVVFTASGTHDPDTTDGKIVGAAVTPDAFALANQGKRGDKPVSGGRRYTTSKLCTVMYAYELDRRLRAGGSSVTSLAFDPGMIPETELTASLPAPARALLRSRLMKRVLRSLGVTIGDLAFSGDMLGKLAIDPAYAGVSGKLMQSRNLAAIAQTSSATSYDEALAQKLWTDSLQIVGLRPEERPRRLHGA